MPEYFRNLTICCGIMWTWNIMIYDVCSLQQTTFFFIMKQIMIALPSVLAAGCRPIIKHN